VVTGLLVVTLGVVGLFRMPDVYTQLHAAGKAVFLGIIAFLVASLATRDPAIAARAALIAAFLILTTPVAAHVIARAAYLRREGMATPGAIDESGKDLPAREEGSPHEEPGPPAPRAEVERDEGAPGDRS
jgi:multicomponent Na+:H+ antiporter subunit G